MYDGRCGSWFFTVFLFVMFAKTHHSLSSPPYYFVQPTEHDFNMDKIVDDVFNIQKLNAR